MHRPTLHYPLWPGALASRHRRPELMDDPALDPGMHAHALAGLRRLNTLGLAQQLLWPTLEAELASHRRLAVLDVATGSGDILAAMHRRARGRIRGLGLDISPTAVDHARRQFGRAGLEYRSCDVLRDPLPSADIVMCSLFLHHLPTAAIVGLLCRMAACARRLLVVSDLDRGLASWWGVWLAARLVTTSPVVHIDSALSVEAALTRGDLLRLARRAGLKRAVVENRFPCRLLLTWRREG